MPELDFERITLNAIPDGDMPVFHASQYETMRPFMADLKWGSEDFAPGDGCWCTLAIRKTDDTLVIIDDIDIDTSTVSCILSQQSVACIGDNFCQLKVWAEGEEDNGCIACLNFILHVQPDPEADGITSESEINNLTEQIEEITQQVIGDDYYTKVQTDALLDLKADKSTTYTKSEVDTALNLKADKSTTYTKSQVDSALALKADASDVYTKAQTYNKTETDTLLAGKVDSDDLATVATTGDYDDLINKPTIPAAQIQSDYAQADNTKVDYIKNKPDIDAMIAAALLAVMPVDSAGPSVIANFNTELAVNLVDCKTTLTPSLDGYSAVNLTACGVNLFDDTQTILSNFIYSSGVFANSVTDTKTFFNIQLQAMLDNSVVSLLATANITTAGSYYYTFIFPSGCNYLMIKHNGGQTDLRIKYPFDKQGTYTLSFDCLGADPTTVGGLSFTNVQIEVGSTQSAYHAYTGNAYAIALGDTYYGGTLDVTSGVLTVEYDSSLQPITPYDVQLLPTAITARAGVNNVYSDTGDTTVQFKDSIQHYIDTRV